MARREPGKVKSVFQIYTSIYWKFSIFYYKKQINATFNIYK